MIISQAQLEEAVRTEVTRKILELRNEWETTFIRRDEKWEVGTAHYFNTNGEETSSGVILRKKVETPFNYGYLTSQTCYREQVVDIILPDLLLALMKHCGLKFEVTPAVKREAEVKIVKRGEVQP